MAFGKNKKAEANIGAAKESKKKKKKGKVEDETPVYENPAFEVYDPGSSFNAQSGFIPQEQPTTPAPVQAVADAVAPVVAQPENLVSPEEIMQQLNPQQYADQVAQTAAQVVAQPQVIDPSAVAQVTGSDSSEIEILQPESPEELVQGAGVPQDSNVIQDPNLAHEIAVQESSIYNPSPDAVDGNLISMDNPNAGLPQEQVNYNDIMSGASSTGSDILNNQATGTEALVAAAGDAANQPLPGEEGREKVARPVRRFRYTIINGVGKKEKGTFEAESEEDVRNFLLSQNYQVLEVTERSKSDIDIGGPKKIGANDLSFSLTQLSTYLKAGIPLSDSVRILAKQSRKAHLTKAFSQLVYQLLKGESLSDAMLMQGNTFPKLLINMVKTAEMTGDLPSILDDMAEYYTSMDQTRKQMKSAMTYPAVVLTIAVGVLVFMLTYLVPQFTSMFEDQGAELPMLTQIIVGVSEFIKTKWMFLIAGVAAVFLTFHLLFTKVQKFRKVVQIILMHLPVVKDVIIYNEMANFSKTFASLLNHSVFITDSMEILSKITENEIYKEIINKTLENLAKGDSISSAFKGQWAIPVVAYEMIVTGESTGQLGAMMEKVANHFQMLHKNVIDQLKSLVEPVMIVFLAGIVGVILVSIIQPMFSIYSQIK